MSAPTLGMTTQSNDSFNYAVLDALSDSVPQSVNLSSMSKMLYGASSNGANTTTTVPTKFYLNTITVTIASSIHDMDLTQLIDIYGNVLNFTKIYRFVLRNNDVSGGSGLIVKPGPSNGWTGPFNAIGTSQLLIQAGGDLVLGNPYVGYTVNSGSKILRFQDDAASPSGNTSFTLAIAGG